MGVFKVLGGVAAGIGVIVALPVFGAVGTITAAGVAVGATVGAIGGAVASKSEESDREQSRQQGYQQGKAESAAEIEFMNSIIKKMESRMLDLKKKEELLIAMFAVGVAVAFCDGKFSVEEQADLEQFVAGAWSGHMPEHILNEINNIYKNPPTFNEAMLYVDRVGREHTDLFDAIIDLMIHSDGNVKESEVAFRQAWNLFKAV